MVGLGARVSLAIRCFLSLLFSGQLPDDVLARLDLSPGARPPVASGPPTGEDLGDRAIQLLALLQRDGRLVDFLQEDISAYADQQVGAAVRDVHASCRGVLERYVTLEPVLAAAEGETVDVSAIDPAHVKVVGTVKSRGAQAGVVRHRGWRVTHVALPPLPREEARPIVAPAEVEVA